MTIELKNVEHLAGLARIAISDEEKKILQHDLKEILGYVSQICNTVTAHYSIIAGAPSMDTVKYTTKLGDLLSVESDVVVLYNIMREDGEPHASGVFTEDLLAGVPAREGNRVSVKKIL